ncbi:heptaprenyl diphosphate synthase component 1 [Gracilibacillus alcaliphilus]|uniref:heptaprenyl diphosphate synthase component 1 n=1 Tax=Gracilibacillus alcaliphilus TaxID=1401441 RepID=UPI00195B555A|nr:heptaprenyl diphosphate synthase component 1 [Gracilibacillus alcaliphilus]MBM7675187.1 heptaprenyl diphosphate synthase [Gracilibacillus alcaliphilus]
MTWMKTIDFYTNLIKDSIDQNFLNERLSDPELDIHKILVLHELLKEREDYTALVHATMLVQIALNTHDNVTKNFDESTLKEQQLTVLAGDYYSGIYYHLLSNQSDITVIRQLAVAISEMTQLKMDVFYTEYGTVAELLSDYQKIEMKLIDKMAEYVKKTADLEYLTDWAMLKRLEYELVRLMQGTTTFLQQLILQQTRDTLSFDDLKHGLIHQYNLQQQQIQDKLQTGSYHALLPQNIDLYGWKQLKDNELVHGEVSKLMNQ